MLIEILAAAARNRLSVCDHFWARMAVFGLREMLVTMRIMLGSLLGSAARERRQQGEARGAERSAFSREYAQIKTRNAHGRRLACTHRTAWRRHSRHAPNGAALTESSIPSDTFEPASFQIR